MSGISTERFASVIVEAADTLVDDFDLVDFLHAVTSRTADLLAGSAVGLMMADVHGTLRFIAASRSDAEMLELFQLQNDEGPCLEAFTSGEPVINTRLRTAAQRWPSFAPLAVSAGYGAVHALPMRLRSQVIGALNVFSSEDASLDSADVSVVQALADVATIGLLQERALQRATVVTEQLQHALSSRIVLEQAKGAVAQRYGVPSTRPSSSSVAKPGLAT